MWIGELARRTGTSVQAVRLYERRGLLPAARRTASGYRVYDERDLELLHTIKRCQRLGCTLAETRQVLALFALPDVRTGRAPHAAGSRDCLLDVARLAERKLTALDERLAGLLAVRGELADVLDRIRDRLGKPGPAPAAAPTPRGHARRGRVAPARR